MGERRGILLASAILGSWLVLHVVTVFYLVPSAHPVISFIFLLVLTWLSVGLFIIAHDAMHGSLDPEHPALSRAIGSASLLLYANFSFAKLLPKHHAHHHAPGQADDPDFHPDHPKAFWRWYWRFMRTYFGWREAAWMTLRVAAYLLLGAKYGNVLLFFALPGLLSSLQLFYFGTWLPHRHDEATFADHHNARTNDYPVWLSLLTCFHFGYHHEHHLSPGTPWWRLPERRGKAGGTKS